ncbi:MAG: dihydroneopterin aldolase [Akkermansiaceae bacterium]
MTPPDRITISKLSVLCHIGVPDEERENAQELLLDLTLIPTESLAHLQDDVSRTIDYHTVALRVDEVAKQKPRRLIETLAEDVASTLLREFPLREITIRVNKFILPQTRSVAVTITRCQ